MSWQPALDPKPGDIFACEAIEMFGIQSWVALSAKDEEAEPDFVHYGADDLPVLEEVCKVVRVIAGSLLGASSPVKTSSPMFYADINLGACVGAARWARHLYGVR